jgi:hypothetical protein
MEIVNPPLHLGIANFSRVTLSPGQNCMSQNDLADDLHRQTRFAGMGGGMAGKNH